MSALTKRAGRLCVEVFQRFYASKPGAKYEVRARLNPEYVSAVQDLVWGGAADDVVHQTFFAS
jgi:hypothetical protein